MVIAVPFHPQSLKFRSIQRHILCDSRRKVPSPSSSRCWKMMMDLPRLTDAAKLTVDTFIKSGMVLGLGSGRASGMVIQYLGQRLRGGALKDIVGFPTSVSSASEAAKVGIPLDDYEDGSQIDFAFDDADIIEEGTLNAVIGRRKLQGGESILQEKSILKAASNRAFIVTEEQYSGDLDGSIPVLVNSINWMETAEEIDDLFLGDAEYVNEGKERIRPVTSWDPSVICFIKKVQIIQKMCSSMVARIGPSFNETITNCFGHLSKEKVWRRPTIGHAGPTGGDFPLLTREGHNVLDLIFTSPILDLAQVAESLDRIEGVLGHGVIFGVPCTAVLASKDGLRIVDNSLKDAIM